LICQPGVFFPGHLFEKEEREEEIK